MKFSEEEVRNFRQFGANSKFVEIIKSKMTFFNENKHVDEEDDKIEKLEKSVQNLRMNLLETSGDFLKRPLKYSRSQSCHDSSQDRRIERELVQLLR